MDDSFHYLSMINHMTIQKKLMEQLKDTGLTLGQYGDNFNNLVNSCIAAEPDFIFFAGDLYSRDETDMIQIGRASCRERV